MKSDYDRGFEDGAKVALWYALGSILPVAMLPETVTKAYEIVVAQHEADQAEYDRICDGN